MGLFIRQDEKKTELQNRVAAELQERLKSRVKINDTPDGIEDSKYIENTKSTTSLAWVWILIVAAVVIIAVWLMFVSMAN